MTASGWCGGTIHSRRTTSRAASVRTAAAKTRHGAIPARPSQRDEAERFPQPAERHYTARELKWNCDRQEEDPEAEMDIRKSAGKRPRRGDRQKQKDGGQRERGRSPESMVLRPVEQEHQLDKDHGCIGDREDEEKERFPRLQSGEDAEEQFCEGAERARSQKPRRKPRRRSSSR